MNSSNGRKPRLVRPIYFAWLVVPLLAWVAFNVWGLPGFAWSYRFNLPSGASYGDFGARHYTFCRYLGFHGTHDYYPTNGKCPFVRWYHPKT